MPDALIWGASGGIGRALVEELRSNGWRVFAAARQIDKIPEAADFCYAFDACNVESIKETAVMVAHETDGIDLVVYAAGGVLANPLEKQTPEDWRAVMAANLDGAYLTAKSSLNLMKKGASMMFIGAYVDKIMLPRMGAYTAAKSGLESMVTILQKENRQYNIAMVRLPAVDTPFWDHVPFSMPDYAMKPQRVAQAVVAHHGQRDDLNLEV